ncbi:14271_t:CDS:1 [Racocetra fulgida]|uniref:Acyl-protein thioesterase 1 n=1 Tax=Racocetra fulgida TaxID=60492 RepID=A0A9N9IP80_9GLOM|nr:14271_t:CDS:1 [Racocetra fulgida]
MNGSTLQNILSPISLEEIDRIVKINQEDLLKSYQTIHQIIQEEIEIGISPWNIFLVGYSQGGSIALAAELTFPHALCGVICLSGILPLYQSACQLAENKKHKTSVLICHGEKDKLVPLWVSQASVEILMNNDYLVEFKIYPRTGHWLGKQRIHDLRKYLREKLYQSDSIKNEVALQDKFKS